MFAKKNKPTIYKLTKLYLAQKLINILDLFFIIFLYVYIENVFFLQKFILKIVGAGCVVPCNITLKFEKSFI